MKILLDLDGVVFAYDFARIVKEHFGITLIAPIYAYDLADELGVANKEIDEMFSNQVWGKPEFVKGALDVLKEWEFKNYEVVIFTNRIKYMGGIELVNYLIKNKVYFKGISGTGQDQDYDFHIDDRPSKLAESNSKNKILFTQSWNEGCHDLKKQFTRVENWQQINEIIK